MTLPDKTELSSQIFEHIQSKNGQVNTFQHAVKPALLGEQNKYKNVVQLLLWR
jgi:hypothetical protein